MLKKMKIGTKLGLFISIALTATSLSIYLAGRYWYKESLNTMVMEKVRHSEQAFQGLEGQDIKLMSSTLEAVLTAEGLKNVYLTGDRERLYEYGQPFFNKLKERYGITHFYFHKPDGTNFVRLHDRKIYGDRIDRFTFKKAQSSGQFAGGMELGKTAFALRVVAPYYDNGKPIGYVELGQEIDHFLKLLKGNSNDEYMLIADKEFLNKEDWASVRKEAGLPDNWGELEKHLWVSRPAANPVAKDCFTEETLEEVEKGATLIKGFTGEKNGFACGGFPITDAGGRHVGAILSLIDISGQIAIAKKADKILLTASAAILVVVFALLYYFIRRSISGPVEELALDARKIADGDLTARVEIKSGDEIGILADTMNDMASRLAITHASLESAVETRTEQLREANKELTALNEELQATNEELQASYSQLEVTTSDLEEAHQELSTANEELKSVDKLKTEFLQTVSHEFRSPLTPVLGYLELMKEGEIGELNAKQKEVVEEMYVCSKNMQLLIDELLEAASIHAGKLYIEFEEVDICRVLKDSVNRIRRYADANKTELDVRTPYCPLFVEGDRRKLSEIFTHIVRNAVKFNHEGGKVLVKAEAAERGVEVEITDTGIGMPEERLEMIFEAFRQVESSSTRHYEGIGIGLYLVRKLIEAHGGKIEVKSEVGMGTTFTIFIPRKRSMMT